LDCGNRLPAPEQPGASSEANAPLLQHHGGNAAAGPQLQTGAQAHFVPGAPAAAGLNQGLNQESRSCASCGTHNPLSSRFCSACGARLDAAVPGQVADGPPQAAPMTTLCARCHGTNPTGMRFCQFCGASLMAVDPAAPAPAPVYPKASLIVIGQAGTPGLSYPVTGGQCDIVRTGGSGQLANDPYVSPRHARLIYRSGQCFMQDLDSLNGIFVRVKSPVILEIAGLVLIGLEVLRFEVVSEAEQRLGPAADRGTQVFGSPAAPRHARLCQRTVEGVTRDIFFLSRTET